MQKSDSVSSSMIFKTMERYVMMAFQMIVQVVIARILSPSDYGIVAMMAVFIAVANVFINNGFNMALVQKKDADQEDYCTALTINMAIGGSMYLLLVIISPLIASFYHQPLISRYMPILGLVLVFGSVNSIQVAIANRQMKFKNLFKCNVYAGLISGIAGVVAALAGCGAWSLIIQQLVSSIVLGITLFLQQHWVPKFMVKKSSAQSMFSFGWMMLAAALINTIYNELNSLVIGKRYSSADLAFYTKGSLFPKYVTTGLDGAICTVMFSAMSRKQADEKGLHDMMKKGMNINTFLVFPCLAILAMTGEQLTSVILTDKWLQMVPFMQICCFTFALHPVGSVQVQALAAVGRSDLRLKMEYIKKGIGIVLLLLVLDKGPIAIALSAAVVTIVNVVVGAIACKRVIHYNYTDTLRDILPILAITVVTCVIMYYVNLIIIHPIVSMVITVIAGGVSYLALASIFNLYGYNYLKKNITNKLKNKIQHVM